MTELERAVKRGDAAAVEKLLAAGADVNAEDGIGRTMLNVATVRGYTDMMRLLIDNGADPDKMGWGGMSPLMTAASLGNVEAVRLLIDRGANPNLQSSGKQWTALMFATVPFETEALHLLLKSGAEVGLRDKFGDTVADIAKKNGRGHTLKTLEEAVARSEAHAVAAERQRNLKNRKPVVIRGMKP